MEKRRRFGWLVFSTMVLALALVLSGPIGEIKAQQKVDLNTASNKELEGLKGIGPAKAKKIIAARPYKAVDELSKAGLSAKEIEGLKPFVTIGAATPPAPTPAADKVAPAKAASTKAPTKEAPPAKTSKPSAVAPTKLAPGEKVNINTASKEKLEALPNIGPVRAQGIIDGRPYKTIEDIKKVKGIGDKIFDKIKDSITI